MPGSFTVPGEWSDCVALSVTDISWDVSGLAVGGEQDYMAQHIQDEAVGDRRRVSDDVRQCPQSSQPRVCYYTYSPHVNISLCIDSCVYVFFALSCLIAYVLYYCNMVGWTW